MGWKEQTWKVHKLNTQYYISASKGFFVTFVIDKMLVHVHFTYVLAEIQLTDKLYFHTNSQEKHLSFTVKSLNICLTWYEPIKVFFVVEKFPLQKFCL